MNYHNFKELNIWKRSKNLVKSIYSLFEGYEHVNSIIFNQIIKSALSIPSNIAEGAGRGSGKQFSYFLDVAYGSSCELETQLIILKELKIANVDQVESFLEEVTQIQKMMYRLKQKISITT